MSSINSILNDAASGVQTAQTALQVVSTNVANVNTPGYVQTVVNQASLVSGAQGSGVTIADIQRVTNQYLEAANYAANAAQSATSTVSASLQQAQSAFGDPSASGSLFSNLDAVFSSFAQLSSLQNTTSGAAAVAATSQFFQQSASIASTLQGLSAQADQSLQSQVASANQLLTQISQLNTAISKNNVSGSDITGAQNQQGELITQLSALMNIKVSATPTGGVQILGGDGSTLVGANGPSALTYASGPAGGAVTLTNGSGVDKPFTAALSSGVLGGLLQLRNAALPALGDQLASLTTGAAAALNSVSNAYSAVPAPSTLTGRSTGLDLSTIAGDFSGKTTIAFVNQSTNAVDHTVAIDFTAQTLSVDGGAATSFTPSSFQAALSSAAASVGGSASFSNGALTLTAPPADGVAIQDDAAAPARDGGQGFSQFFGLNDLVSSSAISNFNTGLSLNDATGFPGGQGLTLQIQDPSGQPVRTVTVTTPASGSMGDLLGALNASSGGVGGYGAFSLNAAGALTFTPAMSGYTVQVAKDDTQNDQGASVSQLFGVGSSAKSAAASSYAVRPDIAKNPGLLQTATLNLSAASGQAALLPGDASGADALGQAGLTTLSFNAAGSLAAASTTLSGYAADVGGAVANQASSASTAASSAAAVATSASTALSSVEGVSIDQEMINLTTYQQAYNASARMIQAASSLFTTLLNMVNP